MYTRATELAEWLRERVNASGARGIAVGLSGGVDSAVVVRLAQMAMHDQVVGVLMPCHSDPRDEADARLVADHFTVATVRVDLAPSYDRLIADLKSAVGRLPIQPPPVTGESAPDSIDIKARVPLANIKPRLRMTTLYTIGTSLGFLVTGTGNKSEITIGYYTKYGDGGVDLLPIGALVKSEVRDLARELGVPARIIDKPPSAGLWAGQTDESEMGFTYEELETFIESGSGSVSSATAARIEQLISVSHHKRALPPIAPA